jgi:hypothetical protein
VESVDVLAAKGLDPFSIEFLKLQGKLAVERAGGQQKWDELYDDECEEFQEAAKKELLSVSGSSTGQ